MLQLFHSADNRSSCGGRSVWQAPVAYDRWIKLLFHIEWSSSASAGSVELFGDIYGTGMLPLMPRQSMFTMKMDPAGQTLPVDSRLGIYRDRTIAGDATAYFDGFTIASDRASAESSAFGGVSAPVEPPVVLPALGSGGDPTGDGDGHADPPVAQASAPPRTCTVPRLLHKRLRAAHLALKRAGCDTSRVQRRRSSSRNRGRVVAQSVRPGAVVRAGTHVRLVVGRGRHG
jgi:hypothetical protein